MAGTALGAAGLATAAVLGCKDDGGDVVPNGAYLYHYRLNFEVVTGAIGVVR